jgi:hypothetical protein
MEGLRRLTIDREAAHPLSVRSSTLCEGDADLGHFGAWGEDQDRLPVAACRQRQNRSKYQALDDSLDLAAIVFGTTLNRGRSRSSLWPGRSRSKASTSASLMGNANSAGKNVSHAPHVDRSLNAGPNSR